MSSLNFPVLLTTEEVAAILKVSPGTLRQWRATKRYPLIGQKIGGAVRYRLEDVQAFVSQAGAR